MASVQATTSSDSQADSDAQAGVQGSLGLGGVDVQEENDRILVDGEHGVEAEGENGQDGWVEVGDPRSEAGKRVKVSKATVSVSWLMLTTASVFPSSCLRPRHRYP